MKIKAKYPHTLTWYKKKTWDAFSVSIRQRGMDDYGFNRCITCGVRKHWKELQAGHFIPGRHNAILFEERGVHPQCYHCNVGLKGNPRKYDAFMRKTYGAKVIKELERLDTTERKFTPQELIDLRAKYEALTT